jgi:hypothetical protein
MGNRSNALEFAPSTELQFRSVKKSQ